MYGSLILNDFGSLGTFGAPRGRKNKLSREQKARRRRKAGKLQQQLFNKFAQEYGTPAWPAWTPDRADCIKAWRAEQADESCLGIVGNMKSFEYLQWLEAGLKSGKFKRDRAKIAERILAQRGENEPVENAGRRKQRGEPRGATAVTADTAGFPWGLALGGVAVVGLGYFAWRRWR